jgi:uncharacterized membrane protein YeaQ/YmgE (transglycosylase-associated protein family)
MQEVLQETGLSSHPLSEQGVKIMGLDGLVIALIIGAIAGWLAGTVVRGGGFGLVGDIIVGILGALVAGWLFPTAGLSLGGGWFGAILSSTIGAIFILVIAKLIKRA